MRPKTTARDLPPRMLRRTKVLKSGKVWAAYYYNGRSAEGKRVELALGADLAAAKRKWAELEGRAAPADTGLMRFIFARYEREILPTKAPRTQTDYSDQLALMGKVFGGMGIDSLTPQHIAQYRDRRGAKAPVRANREIALLSTIFNHAREWGYTARENPCKGVRKNKEQPRDFYADDAVWAAVYGSASEDLRDAMDLAYLTGQRPGDIIKMRFADLRNGALEVQQGKTAKRLRILLAHDGVPTQLGLLIDRIRQRAGPVSSLYLVATKEGQPLNRWTLRVRFDAARTLAVQALHERGDTALADRVAQFQFRDIRPKAASDLPLAHASRLLGHTEHEITQKVYRRVGETVMPTR